MSGLITMVTDRQLINFRQESIVSCEGSVNNNTKYFLTPKITHHKARKISLVYSDFQVLYTRLYNELSIQENHMCTHSP